MMKLARKRISSNIFKYTVDWWNVFRKDKGEKLSFHTKV